MIAEMSKWFRGASPPDKVEQQIQPTLNGLFDATLRERERRRHRTIATPFGPIDLNARDPFDPPNRR
jgi:hypothetical protein